MPYIATEWIDGDPLALILEQGPLAAEVATELITSALEVSELLSHVLGADAIWVETELDAIIVGSETSGRGFTFWISPIKWLGGQEKSHSLEVIAALTEKVMGWQGRKMNDQAGQGLGGWLKWLRHAGDTIGLHEARETLAASVGVNPPPPTRALVARATRPPPTAVKRSSSKASWVINSALALVAVGLGGWFLLRQRAMESSRLSQSPARVAGQNAKPATAASAAEPENPDAAASVVPWDGSRYLAQYAGRQTIVEGVLEKIDFSEEKKTMYLLFSQHPEKTDTRGAVTLNPRPPDLSEATLNELRGKKVRLHGTIRVRNIFGVKRNEILIKDRASIELVE